MSGARPVPEARGTGRRGPASVWNAAGRERALSAATAADGRPRVVPPGEKGGVFTSPWSQTRGLSRGLISLTICQNGHIVKGQRRSLVSATDGRGPLARVRPLLRDPATAEPARPGGGLAGVAGPDPLRDSPPSPFSSGSSSSRPGPWQRAPSHDAGHRESRSPRGGTGASLRAVAGTGAVASAPS